MRSCEEYQELISRLLDDDLSVDEQNELERHAASCPDCAALLAAFRSLSEAIGGGDAEPPEELHENIMAELRREAIRRRQAPRRVRGVLALAACAALVILAAVNLPRMGKAPMYAASYTTAAAPAQAAVYAADEAVPEEPAAAKRGEAAAEEEVAFDAARDALGAVEAAPAPEPADAPEAEGEVPNAADAGAGAMQAEAAAAPAETEPEAPKPAEAESAPLWPYVLVGLLAVAAALLLFRSARRKRQ